MLAINQGWAQGVDISKWDQVFNPANSKHRIDFAIAKGGEGSEIDPRFEQHVEECVELAAFGAYTYYRNIVPWEVQAEFAEAIAAEDEVDFICVDYEPINNVLNSESDEDLRRIVEHLESSQEKPVLIYLSLGTYNDILRRGGDWIRGKLIWVARWYSEFYFYNHATGPDNNIRDDWEVPDWWLWQWGGDFHHKEQGWSVPGYKEAADWGIEGKDSVDLNYYRGSLEDMLDDLNIRPKEAPEPSTQPDPEWVDPFSRPAWLRWLAERRFRSPTA